MNMADRRHMAVFWIKLAEKIIRIESTYEYVVQMCRPYLCEPAEPDIRAVCTEADIVYERGRVKGEEVYGDDYLESLAVYRQIAEQMTMYSTFLMHGAAVAVKGEAYMFTAASGVGKTTRLNRWLEQIEDSYVVNGDKPLLKVTDREILVCGTPWCGKEKLHTNTVVPLRAIVLLERGEKEILRKITFSEAFVKLLGQSYRPENPDAMARTLRLIGALNGKTQFFRYSSSLKTMDLRTVYECIRPEETSFNG